MSGRLGGARRTASGVACLLLAVTGCQLTGDTGDTSGTGEPSEAGPTARPSPSRLPTAPSDLTRFYQQQVEWSECESGFECADVKVPLDYTDPSGATIEIAINRRPADELDSLQGALLVNPGGPGVSGKFYARQLVGLLGPVTETFDLVGVDPRGVGDSEAIDCLSDDGLDEFLGSDGSPDTAAEVQGLVSLIEDLGRGCRQRSGELVAHVSTVEAARDLDIVRQVVGDPAMHYFGASYGTLLGATYAELFPDRVGRMVLDAGLDPTVEGVELSLDQLRGFDTALQAYLRDCVDEGDCPLGESVGEAESALVGLLERIDAAPLPTGSGRELTAGWAFYGIALPLYAEQLWPVLTRSLSAALDGDGGPLLHSADLYVSRSSEGYADNSMEAFFAISCLDGPGARSVAEVRADLPRFERASDVFGPTFGWSTIGCRGWSAEPSEPAPDIDATGAEPILVVGTTRDPATPYEWSQALSEQLDSGVLLTREGDGHGGFGHGNECVDDAVLAYLVDGTVPEPGTRCRPGG